MNEATHERCLTVMVVEDQVMLGLELKTLLARWGFRVLGPAATIDRALDLLEQEQPDVAILDVNIHGESSQPVAEALCAEDTPFILVSGYDRSELPEEVLQHAPLLNKPIQRDKLHDLIDRMAGGGQVATD